MPQDPLSSVTQHIGDPGYLVLSWASGVGTSVSVSFTAAYARVTQFEYAPTQRINLAVSGRLHVFQLTSNESLVLPTIWHDMPFFDGTTDPRGNYTQGLQSLLSFIRYTLNYYANSCTIMCPDGQIEHVQYWGGLEGFQEAGDGQSMSPRAQRWSGTLNFHRCLP
jgi:hypothetical protein